MSVFIQKAIVHVLDSTATIPVLSRRELELGVELYNYLEKLINKALEDDNLKAAEFSSDDNPFYRLCQQINQEQDFVLISAKIAQDLYRIMLQNPTIPPADLVCCLFQQGDESYLGVLKLNYKSNFIHCVGNDPEIQAISLIRQRTVLPSEQQRPEECFFIDLKDCSLRLLEKEYEIEGKKEFYLSQTFLGCTPQLSNREKAKVIDRVTEQVSRKYAADDFGAVARLRKAVTETAATSEYIPIDHVAKAVFQEDIIARREYVDEIRKAGIAEPEVHLSEKLTNRKYSNQKIQTDTGIELQFPADYFNNNEKIEFINNHDGTISILIKNINKIVNK